MDKPQKPVVYSEGYNISWTGFEKIHPFDPRKFRRICDQLYQAGVLEAGDTHEPGMVDSNLLSQIHDQKYLQTLNDSQVIARICELPVLAKLDPTILDKHILTPMRRAVSGTILAAELAVESGFSVNLGGGFHHARRDNGGGFCFYADIPLALAQVFEQGIISTAAVIDLDAHQGDGVALICGSDSRIRILDVYNCMIFPADSASQALVDVERPLPSGTGDGEYLAAVADGLDQLLAGGVPDLVIYNAGTDVLVNDPLGGLDISSDGVVSRDQLVVERCRQAGSSVAMVLSGGYTAESSNVIARSLISLHKKGFW